MQRWLLTLSCIEDMGGGHSMSNNLKMSIDAEDEIAAINEAILRAFEDVEKAGHRLTGIHVGHPRRAEPSDP